VGTHLNLGERIGLLRLPASDMRKVHANFGAKTRDLAHLRWGNTRIRATGQKASLAASGESPAVTMAKER
jgi:hypothetical protein